MVNMNYCLQKLVVGFPIGRHGRQRFTDLCTDAEDFECAIDELVNPPKKKQDQEKKKDGKKH